MRLDVSNLHQLICFVKSIVRPKAKCIGLLQTDIDHLCTNIVKAWLKTIPDNPVDDMGEVIVKVIEGGGDIEDLMLVDGLLYPQDSTYDNTLKDMKGPVKIALYNIMLDHHQSGDQWEDDLDLEYDRRAEASWGHVDILPHVSGRHVSLVACQKVVGWELGQRLAGRGIQVVDRLGTVGHQRLLRLCGGQTVSSVNYTLEEEDLGLVDTFQNIEVNDKKYIRLDNQQSGFVTLMVPSLGEQQAEELEDVIKRSLKSLNDLLTQADPSVVPGGGCFESQLALMFTDVTMFRKHLIKQSLIPGHLDISEAMVNSRSGHLYQHEAATRCQCGLEDNSNGSQRRVPVLEVYSSNNKTPSSEIVNSGLLIRNTAQNNIIIDSFTFKKMSILTAVETAENLSNIGMILSC